MTFSVNPYLDGVFDLKRYTGHDTEQDRPLIRTLHYLGHITYHNPKTLIRTLHYLGHITYPNPKTLIRTLHYITYPNPKTLIRTLNYLGHNIYTYPNPKTLIRTLHYLGHDIYTYPNLLRRPPPISLDEPPVAVVTSTSTVSIILL